MDDSNRGELAYNSENYSEVLDVQNQVINLKSLDQSNQFQQNQQNGTNAESIKSSQFQNNQIVEHFYNTTMADIEFWLKDFRKSVIHSPVSIAANAQEILNNLSAYQKMCQYVLEPDEFIEGYKNFYGSKILDSEQKQALQQVKQKLKSPHQMKLKIEDHGVKTGYFKHIKSMEQLIKKQLRQLIDVTEAKDFKQSSELMQEIVFYLRIVHNLYHSNIQKARNNILLDLSIQHDSTQNLSKDLSEKITEKLPSDMYHDLIQSINGKVSSLHYIEQQEQKHKAMIVSKIQDKI